MRIPRRGLLSRTPVAALVLLSACPPAAQRAIDPSPTAPGIAPDTVGVVLVAKYSCDRRVNYNSLTNPTRVFAALNALEANDCYDFPPHSDTTRNICPTDTALPFVISPVSDIQHFMPGRGPVGAFVARIHALGSCSTFGSNADTRWHIWAGREPGSLAPRLAVLRVDSGNTLVGQPAFTAFAYDSGRYVHGEGPLPHARFHRPLAGGRSPLRRRSSMDDLEAHSHGADMLSPVPGGGAVATRAVRTTWFSCHDGCCSGEATIQ